LRPRGGGRPLHVLGAGGPAGRVRLRALPGGLLRLVLLPEELRLPRLSLATARRRRGARARRHRAAKRRAHAGAPVAPGPAPRERTGDPRRGLLLLAALHRRGDPAGRGLGSDAGDALHQAAQDHRPAHGRADLPQPRSRVLGIGDEGPRRVSVTSTRGRLLRRPGASAAGRRIKRSLTCESSTASSYWTSPGRRVPTCAACTSPTLASTRF